MTITTTGSDADGYITAADADTYAGKYFIGADSTAWNDASESDKEAAIRQATQYVDSYFRSRFVGVIRSTSQALEWPRAAARDRSGRTINGIPDAVKNAVVELAKERLVAGTNLVPSEARGGMVKSERVEGVVDVEYMDGAPSGTTYEFAEKLLSAVLRGAANRLQRV